MSDDIDIVKKPHAKTGYTQQQLVELARCAADPFHFITNYVKIQHPLKGAVPFEPFPFQYRLIDAFHNNRFAIALTARQMGKTTCAAAYLLWRAMYNPDTTVLVVANKLNQALEIMERVKYAYENTPDQFRVGVKKYNEGTLAFDNGSKIIARATSSDAGRGLSITLPYMDEFAFVQPNKAVEFFTSIQPVLSTGGSCIITSTPKSDTDMFAQIWRKAIDNKDEFGNKLAHGRGKNDFYAISIPWTEHPERDEEWARPYREQLGEARFRQEFECVTGNTQVQLVDPTGLPLAMSMGELFNTLKMAA